MYSAATAMCLNFILDFARKYEPPKAKKVIFKEIIKRTLAYFSFVIIAVRIDELGIADLLDWTGSTQYIVCLYIAAREIRFILDYIRQQGITIPGVLDARVGNIQDKTNAFTSTDTDRSSESIRPENIDAKIYSIKQQLEAIEENIKNNGGE